MRIHTLHTLCAAFVALVCAIVAFPLRTQAQVLEAYVLQSPDKTTLTFYYDNLANKRDGHVWGINSTTRYKEEGELPSWSGTRKTPNTTITKVVFDPSFRNYKPTYTEKWCYALANLQTVEGTENLNTADAFSLSNMFAECTSLEHLNLSTLRTNEVTSFESMFYNCKKLKTLDLSGFTFVDYSDIGNMFTDCAELTTIYCNGTWTGDRTFNVFEGCTKLKGAIPFDEDRTDGKLANPTAGYFTFKSKEAYVVQSDDKASLTFHYDTQRASHHGTTWSIADTHVLDGQTVPAWAGTSQSPNTDLQKVVFDPSFQDYHPTTTARWFSSCTALSAVEGMEYLNTSAVTDMNGMFAGCNTLPTIDLSHVNTTQVTNMSHLFSDCAALTALDLSRFNTAQVTDMSGMFKGCAALLHCTLVSFNTEKVTDMRAMFSGCRALPRLDVDKFSLSATTKVSEMFKDCAALQTLFSNKAWTCGESEGMFAGCLQLKGAVNFNDQHTTAAMANPTTGYFSKKMSEAYVVEDDNAGTLTFFYDANYDQYAEPKWKIVDAKTPEGKPLVPWINHNSSYNTNKIIIHPSFKDYRPTNTAQWFSACTKLTAVEGMEYLNTSQVTDMNGMFYGARHLKAIDFSHFDTEKVTDMSHMFEDCIVLEQLDLSRFNTAQVTDMSYMFKNCQKLTTINLNTFTTEQVTTMKGMFAGCINMTLLHVNPLNTAQVTDMSEMFDGCQSLGSLELMNFNTKKVTNMSSMFKNCKSLFAIYCNEKWSCEKSTDMFLNCFRLEGQKISYNENATDVRMANHVIGYFKTKYEPYVILSPDGKTLNFYHNDHPNLHEGTKWGIFERRRMGGKLLPAWAAAIDAPNTTITKAVIDEEFQLFRLHSTAYWFHGLAALTDIEGLPHLATSEVTTMRGMFHGCQSLKTFDTSHFTTKEVADMSDMFRGCSALTKLNLEHFNTSNATDMSHMFEGCTSLTELQLVHFNTERVQNMSGMFEDCAQLTTLYCNFTWQCPQSEAMFKGCTQLKGAVAFDANRTDVAMAQNKTGYFTPYTIPYVELSPNRKVLTFYNDNQREERLGTTWGITEVHSPSAELIPAWAGSDAEPNYTITKVVFDPSFQTVRPTSLADWCAFFMNLTEVEGLQNLNTTEVTSLRRMFTNCMSLPELDLTSFNTNKVTDMSEMFAGCSDMVKVNVSSFNTAAVTTLDMMFAGCSSLTSLDLTNFNTSNVAHMALLFGGCSSLKQLDLSSFNTANVETMERMFNGCSSMTTFAISHFNTAKVTDMSDMFKGCSAMQQIDLSNFNTNKVTNMGHMFNECTSLKHLDLSKFNTEQLIHAYSMFYGCSALESLNLTPFVLSDQTNTDNMFEGCSSLRAIYCSNAWKSRSSKDMFKDCLKLKGAVDYDDSKTNVTMANPTTGYFTIKPQDKPEVKTPEAYVHQSEDQKTLTFYYDKLRASRKGHTWGINETKVMQNLSVPAWAGTWEVANETTTKVVFDASFQEVRPTTTAYWFLHYKALTDFQGLEHLNTSEVTDMTAMFSRCLALSTLDLTSLNTKQVTNLGLMFSECIALKQLNLSGFNTENVTNMMYLFNECAALEKIDLTHFNTSSVTNMYGLFDGCKSLTTLDLKSFNTSGVNDMSRMFSGCQALTQIDLSNFNTANVTNMSYMFSQCAALAQLDLSSFNTANVTNMSYMFNGCAALESLDLSHFNTTNVVEMTRMFSESKKLAHIQCLDSWQCPQSAQMFEGCLKLKGAVDYDDSKTDVTMANPETGYFSKYPTAIDRNFLKAHKAQGFYTLQGKRVNGSLQHLPAGVYIVNGKKVVVRH